MDKFHFLDIKGRANEKIKSCVSDITSAALATCREYLPALSLDVVFLHSPRNIIAETGIGGMSESDSLLYIYFNMDTLKPGSSPLDNLPKTIAHEYHHCCRRDAIGYGETLGEHIVSEGLADHFTNEVFGPPLSPWSVALDTETLMNWSNVAASKLDDVNFDYFEWFLGYGDRIPMWAGYSIGWSVINSFIKANPKENAASLVGANASHILRNSYLSDHLM